MQPASHPKRRPGCSPRQRAAKRRNDFRCPLQPPPSESQAAGAAASSQPVEPDRRTAHHLVAGGWWQRAETLGHGGQHLFPGAG